MSSIAKTISLFLLALSFFANAESVPFKSKYRSEVDENLTVHRIALLPTTDNVQGIYARQVESHLKKFFADNHHWELASEEISGPMLSPIELEGAPDKVAEISRSVQADAFIASRVTKGPNGINIHIDLFLTKDQRLLSQAIIDKFKRFEVEAVKEKAEELTKQALAKIPYDALILSRKGNLVTINLGKKDGVEKGKVVTVIQIIKQERHPKFGLLIKTDKEILGKVKILKIDDTLSFGKIIVEKEKGAIQKYAKISGLDFVTYAQVENLEDNYDANEALLQRPDGPVSFGKMAAPWLPQKPPTFGQVGVSAGLGVLTAAHNTGSSNLEAKDPYYPNLLLEAELWLTSNWNMSFDIRQGIGSTDNPKGSNPSKLSHAISGYDLLFSRVFRLGPSIWAGQVELIGGMSKYRNQVDSVSGGLTTLEYSGYKFGIDGNVPVTKNQEWAIGANLYFTLLAKLSENPANSGSSDNTVNKFGLYGVKKLGINLRAKASLDFELYSSNFSGTSAVSASQKHTLLTAGIYYMF